MFCPTCGKEIRDESAFCPACGVRLATPTARQYPLPRSSRRSTVRLARILVPLIMVAAILGVFVIRHYRSQSGSGAWSMFRYNAQHTGRCPYDTSRNVGALKWKYKPDAQITSSPAIAPDGTIYAVSYTHLTLPT